MNFINRNYIKKINRFKPFILFLAVVVLCSHDLYIKMDSYFLQPNQEATLILYNGTFEKSENAVKSTAMSDASFLAHGERKSIDENQWQQIDSTITQLNFKTGKPGTYVAGVSTIPKLIELSAESFNSYLKSDGVLDMYNQREKDNSLNENAVEQYQKNVKAIYQVGDVKTEDWKSLLGYTVEFVPLENPYDKYTGDSLQIQLLLNGKPLANQLVFTNHIASAEAHTHNNQEHSHNNQKTSTNSHSNKTHSHDVEKKHTHEHENESHSHTHESSKQKTHTHKNGETHDHEHKESKHSHTKEHTNKDTHSHKDAKEHSHESNNKTHSHTEENHSHTAGHQLRTNDQGVLTVDLPEDGIYYFRTIHMVKMDNNETITHQSNWATLTFQVSHKHDSSTHTHEEHETEDGIPTWVFILGSILFIGILFLVFRKK